MDKLASSELNDEQIAAIWYPEAFLTAHDSGKTKTLTYKIASELTKIKNHRDFIVAAPTHIEQQTKFSNGSKI